MTEKLMTITAEKAHDILSRAKKEKFDYLPFQQLSKEGREMRADIEARQMRGEIPRESSFIVPKEGYVWKWIACRSH
jgi:hypothetical protein